MSVFEVSYEEDAGFRFFHTHQSHSDNVTRGVGTQCARNRIITKMKYQQFFLTCFVYERLCFLFVDCFTNE